MSITTYDGRSLPSVFSDIPSRNEVQAARQRAGRMWIWVLLLIGIVIAMALASAWLWNQWQLADADARTIEQERATLAEQQREYTEIASRRDRLQELRQTVDDKIEVLGADRTNGQAWERRLRGVAQTTWHEQRLSCGAPCATWQDNLVMPGGSQTWSDGRDAAMSAMDRETAMMEAVSRRVDSEIASLRRGGAGGGGPACNPVTGANCQ